MKRPTRARFKCNLWHTNNGPGPGCSQHPKPASPPSWGMKKRKGISGSVRRGKKSLQKAANRRRHARREVASRCRDLNSIPRTPWIRSRRFRTRLAGSPRLLDSRKLLSRGLGITYNLRAGGRYAYDCILEAVALTRIRDTVTRARAAQRGTR